MEHGKKYFVDMDHWDGRLEKRELDKKIYLAAERLLNGDPYIEKISGYGAFASLIGSAVVGVGLYQGVEFVFNNRPQDILALIPVFFKRLISAVKFSHGTECYKIYLSRDTVKNIDLLVNFTINLR